MTLDEKIEFFQAKTDKLMKRVGCCMWFFLITGIWFVGNSIHAFYQSRNWSRFIAVSGGKFPWPTPPEEVADIMREHADDEPTFAEFELYQSMLVTAAVMLVMGVVYLRYACMSKFVTRCKGEWMAKRALWKGYLLFVVFMISYICSKYSCAKVMKIGEVLQSNGTVGADGHPHRHHGRSLQEFSRRQHQDFPKFDEMPQDFDDMFEEVFEAMNEMQEELPEYEIEMQQQMPIEEIEEELEAMQPTWNMPIAPEADESEPLRNPQPEEDEEAE